MNRNKSSHQSDPNSENSLALPYFEAVADKNENSNMFKCKLCNKIRNGCRKSNLVSHLKCMHGDVYIEKVKKNLENASLNLQLERMKLLQYCVELTTINKQPFALLLKSGFQKIVADKLQELQKGGLGLNLKDTSFGAVQTHIHKTAERIRSIIGCEIKNRLFSTSTDIVTKNNRSIFGIYIQYMMSGELRIRCAGMRELHDRHTGKYLSEILDACLKNYGASLHNVFSLTIDNHRVPIKKFS